MSMRLPQRKALNKLMRSNNKNGLKTKLQNQKNRQQKFAHLNHSLMNWIHKTEGTTSSHAQN